MTRSWADLLGDEAVAPESFDEGQGFFSRLRDSLGKSRRALTEEISVAAFDPGDSASWERLEEALIAADVGVPATAELVQRLEARGEATELAPALQEEIARLLGEPARLEVGARPAVILVVGVNGTGKTTTIGKLAAKLSEHGRSVLVAAADTFRAAAAEIWARGPTPTVGSDAAATRRRSRSTRSPLPSPGATWCMDTAGRLHTQANLMEELTKVRRVIGQRLGGAPHETLLVIDATTGQNGLQQRGCSARPWR